MGKLKIEVIKLNLIHFCTRFFKNFHWKYYFERSEFISSNASAGTWNVLAKCFKKIFNLKRKQLDIKQKFVKGFRKYLILDLHIQRYSNERYKEKKNGMMLSDYEYFLSVFEWIHQNTSKLLQRFPPIISKDFPRYCVTNFTRAIFLRTFMLVFFLESDFCIQDVT